jgi:alpha-tubulin suppressor-like RCC1 family protein
MIGGKKFRGLLFLVGIMVFFGLSSTGCGKKSSQTGKTGGETIGGTTFTSPEDAAKKVFGNLSGGPAGMITGRMITGRMSGMRGSAPRFSIGGAVDSILSLLLDIRSNRIFERQNEDIDLSHAFLPSCDDIKEGLQCTGGGSSDVKCSVEGSTTKRLNFDIKLSDCKVYEGGVSTVSTGSIKGYMELAGNIPSGISVRDTTGGLKIIYFIESQDLTVSEIRGGREVWKLRTVARNYMTEFSISGDTSGIMRLGIKLSGSYSNEDILNKRRDEYLFESFGIEVTMSFSGFQNLASGRFQRLSSFSTSYVRIEGKYSFNTSPKDECVKGEFVFKTIEAIEQEFGSGITEDFLCSKRGKFQVNNAIFEFSSGGIKVTVGNQSFTYSCKDVGKLCEYEPLPTLTITAGTGGIGGGEEECPVWYKDADGDGYTDGTTQVSCKQPTGYVSQAPTGDCDDGDSSINPGRAEICDGEDNNCNGQIDEGVLLVFYKDVDGDGYTDGTTQVSCNQPTGYVSQAPTGDCDDVDSSINPGRAEICDNKDNNCNGQIDEEDVCVFVSAKVSAGGSHTCAIKTNGSLWCWGNNLFGQLGDRTNTDRNTPIQIMPSGATSVSLGGSHTCAVKTNGSLWCWGTNGDGELGDGTNTAKNTPVQIMSSGVSSVELGQNYTCAVTTNGSLWCWGYNGYGQLGDGTNTAKNTPVQVMSSGVVSVALGYYHTCVIKTNGSLWCWGNNTSGQIGDGTNIDKNTPVQIMPSGVSSVSLGKDHTCAIKTNGSLWCWGYNYLGQLGDGANTSRNTPFQIMSSGVSSVSLGDSHTCAIKTNGSLWCWGNNTSGQLGDGTNTNKNAPVQIMSSGVSSVSLGYNHTCAIKTDGSLWCWGDNYYSQLGDGTNTNKNTPVYIMSLGSGGGGAPSVFFGDKSSFDNREEIQANIGQKQTIYGCSSANVVSYIIYLIFPAFILFALRKVRD